MEERDINNENQLSSAQRVHDTSKLMMLGGEGRESTSTDWKDKISNKFCEYGQPSVLSPEALPPMASLLYPRRNRFTELLERIPKPEGYLPKMHLPAWIDLPLDKKLPMVPLESFVFSRGRLNQPLNRDGVRDYTTVDPYNFYNFLPFSNYNALHDPSTQKYFKRPHVQKLLKKQGLITDQGEVICSQKDINNYREYLNHLQCNELIEHLQTQEQKVQHQTKLHHELRHYLAINDDDYKVRMELIMERRRMLNEERVRQIRAKIQEDRTKAKRNRDEIRRKLAYHRAQAKRCAEHERKQRMALACYAEKDCQDVSYLEKMARAELMAYIVSMRKGLEKKLRQAEFIVAKSDYQQKQVTLQKEMIDKVVQSRVYNKEEYQRQVDRRRQQYPALSEKRKENRKRVLYIMRKFLNIWRAYVKRRKARRANPNHQSSWDVTNSTLKTSKQVHELCGHEKFDDFIVNLIKLKRGMEHDLEQEEDDDFDDAETQKDEKSKK